MWSTRFPNIHRALDRLHASPRDSASIRTVSFRYAESAGQILLCHTHRLMDCDERTRLLEHCATTMHAYTQASIKWQELTRRGNGPEYRHSRDAREQARVQVDLASYELEKYEGLHHCFPATKV